MGENTSVILFEAAENYANETSDVSIRSDLRMAFVAGAEWQWERVAAKDAENDGLREALEALTVYSCHGWDIRRGDMKPDRDGEGQWFRRSDVIDLIEGAAHA